MVCYADVVGVYHAARFKSQDLVSAYSFFEPMVNASLQLL